MMNNRLNIIDTVELCLSTSGTFARPVQTLDAPIVPTQHLRQAERERPALRTARGTLQRAVASVRGAERFPQLVLLMVVVVNAQLLFGRASALHLVSALVLVNGAVFFFARRGHRAEAEAERLSGLNGMLRDEVDARRVEAERLRQLAARDDLTGLLNRRQFTTLAERELSRSNRYGQPPCALMLDVDHFKAINDTYGHDAGDDVLRALADRITAQVRDVDLVGRLGGEEFAVLLAAADESSARVVAERIREVVSATSVPTRKGPISLTLSIGLAPVIKGECLRDLLCRADEALYMAKDSGRNRVVTHRP